MHPVRTVKHAVTPKPVRAMSRAVYTVTNPLGAAENKLIGAALAGGRKRTNTRRRTAHARRPATSSAGQTASSSRAQEGAAATARLATLMAVQRERFSPVKRPVLAPPSPPPATTFIAEEWARRKGETRFWQRSRRKALRIEVNHSGTALATSAFAAAQMDHARAQAEADAWWQALSVGDQPTVTAALVAAFADNAAPVLVRFARGDLAELTISLPGMDVLPEKKAHVTPGGRPSSKAWTKTELHQTYAELLGAHLLATIRETWAVGPSLTRLRIRGERGTDLLFEVEVGRSAADWSNDAAGMLVLNAAPRGLNRVGRVREVRGWALT
jgi:hypothetical protein